MTDTQSFWVILFDSTSEALLAEKLLKATPVPHKVIPVPRKISSDCGVCIRFSAPDIERVGAILDGAVPFRAITPLE